ncbi:MAG: RNA methyltransferase [Proteobacteria bacterium]|nr:RNA methyltransferase [Pseudomonadota bacterium]
MKPPRTPRPGGQGRPPQDRPFQDRPRRNDGPVGFQHGGDRPRHGGGQGGQGGGGQGGGHGEGRPRQGGGLGGTRQGGHGQGGSRQGGQYQGGAGGGDRPWRSDRPRTEHPRAEHPRGDTPRPDQPRADQPRGDRPFAPRGEGRGFGGRAEGAGPARPWQGKPGGGRFQDRGGNVEGEAPRRHQGGPRGPRRGAPHADAAPRAPRGGAETPSGAVWLYGLHAIAAALANPARRLRRLLLTEEALASLQERVPAPWPLPHETVDRQRLEHLLGRDVAHQGMALLADLLMPPGLAQTLQRSGPLVVLDQVTDPRNVGAILRSAAAFGAAAVITQDRNAPEETGALAKAASGALETVPLLRAVNIARTLIALKAANLWVVGLDAAAPGPLSGPALSQRRVALVLGAEGEGMRRLTRDTCDELVALSMPGAMESLNVSAAAAIALYEITRRA